MSAGGSDDAAAERRAWRRAARGRLRFELAGIAFAKAHGLRPEDWSAQLWSGGAVRWMGADRPGADQYLEREADAFATLYPEVRFERSEWTPTRAALQFTRGCLGGWGRDRWATARGLGLDPEEVCRYCAEAFRLWAAQLGLDVEHECGVEGLCRLVATRPGVEDPP
jgi:hypothetical protein